MLSRPIPTRALSALLALLVLSLLSPACATGGFRPEPAFAETVSRGFAPAAEPSLASTRTGAAEAPLPMAGLESWDRKLIRTAELAVEVEAVAPAVQALAARAAAAGGFLLQSQEDDESAWVSLRVPALAFEETLAGLGGLGKVTHRSVHGEDVTEEFVDLEARIRNAEQVRARLAGLLEQATRIEEMLNIEQELARIQERIEQMRGRLQYLSHRVELSTISVRLQVGKPAAWPGPITLVARGASWLVRQLFWIDRPGK